MRPLPTRMRGAPPAPLAPRALRAGPQPRLLCSVRLGRRLRKLAVLGPARPTTPQACCARSGSADDSASLLCSVRLRRRLRNVAGDGRSGREALAAAFSLRSARAARGGPSPACCARAGSADDSATWLVMEEAVAKHSRPLFLCALRSCCARAPAPLVVNSRRRGGEARSFGAAAAIIARCDGLPWRAVRCRSPSRARSPAARDR
jgi:hypothetical protein